MDRDVIRQLKLEKSGWDPKELGDFQAGQLRMVHCSIPSRGACLKSQVHGRGGG